MGQEGAPMRACAPLEGIERQVNLRMAAVRSRDAGYPAPPHRSLGLKGSKGERRRREA